MDDPITTRELERSDVEPVLDLLRAALGESPLLKRTSALFAWKHFSNPFGESIAVVAEAGSRIVGLRAFMRWELRTPGGEELRCVRAVDTATHPDFHRRGIFRRLTEEALEVARVDGVDMVFNTPNARSGAGYLSMGWRPVGDIGVLIRPTRHLLGRSDGEGPYMVSAPPVASLDITDRPPRGLRTPRTNSYLQWRFESHPTARYFEVVDDGSVAVVRPNVRKGRRELLISDLYGPSSRPTVKRAIRSTRAPYVATWFSKGSPERAACQRAGLLPLPGVTALTLMVRPLHNIDLDISSMSSWDLALSDLELL